MLKIKKKNKLGKIPVEQKIGGVGDTKEGPTRSVRK